MEILSLAEFVEEHFHGKSGLRAGCSESDFAPLEHVLGQSLPDDFKSLYRQFDGQERDAVGLIYGLLRFANYELYEDDDGLPISFNTKTPGTTHFFDSIKSMRLPTSPNS